MRCLDHGGNCSVQMHVLMRNHLRVQSDIDDWEDEKTMRVHEQSVKSGFARSSAECRERSCGDG